VSDLRACWCRLIGASESTMARTAAWTKSETYCPRFNSAHYSRIVILGAYTSMFCERAMKKLVFAIAIVLVASPAWAQTKSKKASVDVCAPIGRTGDGQLIYSLKCNNLPAPPPPPPQAVAEPPPEPAVVRSGIFGMSWAPPGVVSEPSAPAGQ